MAAFNDAFSFSASPFESYVAENEPEIEKYAVAPPYFETTKKYALSANTHILFGFRGAGKSATRITTEKEVWSRIHAGESAPLVVPFLDFSFFLEANKPEEISLDVIVKRVAFLSLEAMLIFLSSQDNGADTVELLNEDEQQLFSVLLEAFYFPVPDSQRQVSHREAMQLLRKHWYSKAKLWVEKKWSQISGIIAKVVSEASSAHLKTESFEYELRLLLNEHGAIPSPRLVFEKISELSKVFGFTGVIVFVDKVDEHGKTQSSPQRSAQLIYPVLSQVQLLEIDGFGWQFFLWDKIKAEIQNKDLAARLDRVAFSEVSWSREFLVSMIESRINYFSDGSLRHLRDMLSDDISSDEVYDLVTSFGGNSPREIIRLLNTIAGEYDSAYAAVEHKEKLARVDINRGIDKYIQNVIWSIYPRDVLSQLIRLGQQRFINKDVQEKFKISAPGATNRIGKWSECGAVRLRGTRAAEGGAGGKPANEYEISDVRIDRMIQNELYDSAQLTEAPPDE